MNPNQQNPFVSPSPTAPSLTRPISPTPLSSAPVANSVAARPIPTQPQRPTFTPPAHPAVTMDGVRRPVAPTAPQQTQPASAQPVIQRAPQFQTTAKPFTTPILQTPLAPKPTPSPLSTATASSSSTIPATQPVPNSNFTPSTTLPLPPSGQPSSINAALSELNASVVQNQPAPLFPNQPKTSSHTSLQSRINAQTAPTSAQNPALNSTPNPVQTLPQFNSNPTFQPIQPSAQPDFTPPVTSPIILKNNGFKQKMNKKLLIMIGAGVGLVAIFLLVLFLVILPGDSIRNVEQLKTALSEKKPINCTITSGSSEVLLQTDNEWDHLRMKMKDMNVLSIKDDYIYTWYDDNSYGNRIKYSESIFNSLSNSIPQSAELGSNEKLSCKPSNQADFNMPSGVEF
ncbi:MAG: hypothetical protein LBM09_02285 [Candidatus Nomurabacteria bacterium]|jgi:hypothetical protein|nr:hypothetical protein [Candidatus Nomurabacteria bacterium]